MNHDTGKDGIVMAADILKDAETRMSKAIDALHGNLATIRTGRATPALLDRIHVDYYGTSTPLNQLAGISAPEPRLLVIQPWDRGSMGPIERAIQQSDLGLTPNNDGQLIRISIPALTEERRKQLVKVVHQTVEESKVAVRNIRRDAVSQLRKQLTDKEISEDDERRAADEIDTLSKKFVDQTEQIGKDKEQEVLEV
jgi:ribosome recycling factor